MNSKMKVIRFFGILIILFISFNVKSQVSHTLYFMDRVPQFTTLNPAAQTTCNFYFGIPALSSINFDVGNSSLSVSNVLQYNKQIDSLTTFLHPLADRSIFLDAFKSTNSFFFNSNIDIISFGFRVKDWYLTYYTSLKSDVYVTYSKDLPELLLNGSDVGTITDLKKFGLYSSVYIENALGASYAMNEEWYFGAGLKLLSGLSNISTLNNGLTLQTYEDQEGKFINTISSDFALRTYLPFFKETKNTDSISLDSIFQPVDNLEKQIKPFSNIGIGCDLGAIYYGIENMRLSLGLIDMGFITWSKNTSKYKMHESISYSGVEIKQDSLDNAFEDFGNSFFKDSIKFSKTSEKYTTYLPFKVYLGAEYFLETYFSFGLLSVSQFYLKNYYQQLTFSGNFRPLNAAMISVSYSFFNNGFSNMGIGFALRPLPGLQVYFISDNIPLKYSKSFMPHKAKGISFQFGMNFIVGCSKKFKDKPLSWE